MTAAHNFSAALSRFGLEAFRPGQQRTIEALFTTGAALAVFPTGGGKSLCYQLPAQLLDGVTVVVSPLIALMKDQIDDLQRRGIQAARLDASLSSSEVRDVGARLTAGALKLLYVAPERFNNERFLEQMARVTVALFAVDEAHCISQWGHNFRPDYLKLAEVRRDIGAERVLALTATATPSVVKDICDGFGIPRESAVVIGFYRPNLELVTTPVTAARRDDTLLQRLRARTPGSAIVYVTLQRTAEDVAARLQAEGLPARAYHAGMGAEDRNAVQEWWAGSQQGIAVATIAFGMGIDKPDVRAVYHYNLPKGLESYSQEIGRAGRDGQPATVELLACVDDVPVLENFAYGDTPTSEAVNAVLEQIAALGEQFDLSVYEMSTRHDIRPLVLRTLLTYLELLEEVRQGTPFYAGYEVRPTTSVPEILGRFDAERARFVEGIFARARKGRVWYAVHPESTAAGLHADRARVVRALDYLAEQGLVELRASDPRQRFRRLQPRMDVEALSAEMLSRFEERERREVARVQQILDLVRLEGCQVNALVGYFGERRAHPCGHCTYCRSREPLALPPGRPVPPIGAVVQRATVRALAEAHPAALRHPRQQARFLCGLASPALSSARLTRNPLFGALSGHRFPDVLECCQQT